MEEKHKLLESSFELDGTVENSAMEKGVIWQWFERRLAWGEGSCVLQGSNKVL